MLEVGIIWILSGKRIIIVIITFILDLKGGKMKNFLLLIILIFIFPLMDAEEIRMIYQGEGIRIIIPTEDNFELSVIPIVKETIWTNGYGEVINVFKYNYKVISSSISRQYVWKFEIPRSSNMSKVWEVYEYKPYFYKDGLASYPLNENWLPVEKLANWTLKICYEGPGLLPDDSIEFVFISIEIPDLSYWYAEGEDTIITGGVFGGPPYVGEEQFIQDSISAHAYNKTPFGPGRYGKTTGPGPNPPMVYDEDYPWYQGRHPKAAYLHLQDRIMHCMRAEWIQDSRIKDHIWRNIWKAADLNSAGKSDRAKDILGDLLTYLDRQKNKKNRKITEEGYYTLYYRIRYVKDNMWYRP